MKKLLSLLLLASVSTGLVARYSETQTSSKKMKNGQMTKKETTRRHHGMRSEKKPAKKHHMKHGKQAKQSKQSNY